MLKTTPKEALASNEKFYFTGKACKYGHIEKRYTHSRLCFTCSNPSSYQRKYYTKNKAKWKVYQSTESYLKFCKNYRQNFQFIRTAYEAKRRFLKRNATPVWANLQQIKKFYKNCPKGMEVDHIIPLKNDLVCGLHTLENLQYLSKTDNRTKHNKFIPLYQ